MDDEDVEDFVFELIKCYFEEVMFMVCKFVLDVEICCYEVFVQQMKNVGFGVFFKFFDVVDGSGLVEVGNLFGDVGNDDDFYD